MGSKGHFIFSIIKSVLRIVGCILAIITHKYVIGFSLLGIAELCGIGEEFADKRK